MSAFADRMATMLAAEATACRGNPERWAEMVESLAAGLGFTVAMMSDGNPAMIDEIMAGAEAHAHGEAVAKSPIARVMRVSGL